MKNQKTILISDLHFGNKNNSTNHNDDLLKFFETIISDPRNGGINNLYVLGDVFHQREQLDISTINAAIEGFNMLSRWFNVIVVKGNHDLYYRDRRDVHSLVTIEKYVDIVDYNLKIDDKLLTSWLLNGEEYDEIIEMTKKDKIKQVFGHYEFSKFKMNDHYVMEHGQSHKELSHVNQIFTGHYHKRQEKDNVIYIGTPFPFDFNDANDMERGYVVVDGDDYEYRNYQSVSVVSVEYKEFLADNYTNQENTTIRVIINEDIDQVVMDELKDKMEESNFRDSRIAYKIDKKKEEVDLELNPDDIKDIDTVVLDMIRGITTEGINPAVLEHIYKSSVEEGNDGH